ncbi:DUF7286 family protein [Halovenus sp. HT40]|uniref:DUF7286 family protein n=1 Tax=Halovenus sp. HT40 TaxID=3126691 RepID=UPI00300E906E
MTGRVSAVLADRRARVPFALIGLALLLLSATFVLQLETRENPKPARETDRAIEQTESATETALTEALQAASEEAAREPMTEPAATPYGEVLAESGAPFEQYLKALVYLNANEGLETAGQEVGAVQTHVSVPDIGNAREFEDALDRVTIRPGSETDGVEFGVIEAEIEGIQTIAKRDGEVVDRQTESVTVAVASPLYQLHHRTNEFQGRLDAGLTKPGFTQRFNARIYALGWARGYAQYSGLPVTDVIANRHVVPSANDAVYRTQKDVFGAADPNLNNAIRRGWLCMAMHDAEGLYNNYANTASDVSTELCDASRWLFGNQATGDVPEAPGVLDLLGEAPGMDAKHTIGVNETSLLPIRDLATSSGSTSISQSVDRVYEITVGTDLKTTVTESATLHHDRPNGAGRSRVVERSAEVTDVSVEEIRSLEPSDEFQAVDGEVTLEIEEQKEYTRQTDDGRETVTTTASGTEKRSFEIRIEERARNPNAKVDEYNHAGSGGVPITEEYVYGSGPGVTEAATDRTIPLGTDGGKFENYGDPGQGPLNAIFDPQSTDESSDDTGIGEDDDQQSTVVDRIEQRLTNEWERSRSVDDLEFSEGERVSVPVPSRTALRAAILYDLRQIQQKVSRITHTFDRSEILHDGSDTGPYGELRRKVRERKAKYLERDKPFASAGQKAMYEARYAYFSALERYLDRVESAHGSAMGEIDDQLPDAGLERAMEFLQQGVTATPPDPVPLDSSSLTDDVSYEVSGSPTYLVAENVTSETVPAIDDGEKFAPMAVKNRNYLKLPYETVVKGLLSRIGNALGLSEPDAELTFQMASEALVASEESIEAAEADPDYGDPGKLRLLSSNLESAVDSSIDEYSEDVAAQIAFNLYPEDIIVLRDDIEPPRSIEDCDSEPCFVIPEDCSTGLCSMEDGSAGADAKADVTAAVERAIGNYGDTARTADAIASGEISEAIVRELMGVDSDLRPEYAQGMEYAEWRTVVNSSTRHVVRDAAGEHGVTLSDTDTVETLDTEIRQTLESVSAEIVSERFDAAVSNGSFDIENYDNWVNGTQTPVRVPAGIPVLPVPGYWYATVNAWNIEVEGEYARFEVSANMGSPETATTTTYVREDRAVEREVAGSERQLGSVEEISFSGRSLLIVAVPPGKLGVGDRDDEDPECSPTWPAVGETDSSRIQCGGLP